MPKNCSSNARLRLFEIVFLIFQKSLELRLFTKINNPCFGWFSLFWTSALRNLQNRSIFLSKKWNPLKNHTLCIGSFAKITFAWRLILATPITMYPEKSPNPERQQLLTIFGCIENVGTSHVQHFLCDFLLTKNRRKAASHFVFRMQNASNLEITFVYVCFLKRLWRKSQKMLNNRYCIFLKTPDTKMMDKSSSKIIDRKGQK